jgi:hypothetical protein
MNACKDIGLAMNTEKTKYMGVGSYQGMVTNEPITVGNNSYEKVKVFKHLGSLLKNQTFSHEEIEYRLKSGNA